MTSPLDEHLAAAAAQTPEDLAAQLHTLGRWYVTYHRGCGHIGTYHRDRFHLANSLDRVPRPLRDQLRIRVATVDDLIASVRGERCTQCLRPPNPR